MTIATILVSHARCLAIGFSLARRGVPHRDPSGAAKYAKLHADMRQGTVELIDGDGEIIDRAWAPRLRTRW
jgi:hypothetical protein